ncbi:hypothetical protein AVEN_201404-1 [Araneus ventricosus]|uniref:Uncharacterized protein n=1 Tax=Araneus ventricosus TaxID=182803 RepID=A0A4Y2QN25_ARAVE|nr:hypothetical protein AVEN_201404-1 [Araneus ventricosus]
MGRHRRRPPRRAILVARTSDRCKQSDLPSASIAAVVGLRARIRCYAFFHVIQHDGASAHYRCIQVHSGAFRWRRTYVRLHLNATYGQQWIGRGGPVLWPARSPDLTCLDYFLCGYVKSLVFETSVNSAEELIARIAAVTGEVRDTPGIFVDVRSSMRRRCEACITAQGRNFERLL